MEVKYIEKTKKIVYNNLCPGDAFRFKNFNQIFLAVNEYDHEGGIVREGHVSLSDGEFIEYDEGLNGLEVILIDAEVTARDMKE